MKNYRHTTAVAFSIVLLAAALMFAVLSQTIVNAQETSDATVIIAPSQGGTTDPGPGTYTYPNGTDIVLTATANPGFTFQYWVASGGFTPGHAEGQTPIIIDPETGEPVPVPPRPSISGIDSLVFTTNPATVECGYGYTYTYQAVFAQTDGGPVAGPTDAVVVILPSANGMTDPANGTYVYPNGTLITLRATPNEGYEFHYWVIAGNATPGHIQTQPAVITDPETGEVIGGFPRPQVTELDSLVVDVDTLEVECGFGYTYVYQAVFTEADETGHSPSPGVTESPGVTPTISPGITESPPVTASPSPGVTPTASPGGQIIAGIDDWVLIAIVVIVIIIIVAAIAAAMRRR